MSTIWDALFNSDTLKKQFFANLQVYNIDCRSLSTHIKSYKIVGPLPHKIGKNDTSLVKLCKKRIPLPMDPQLEVGQGISSKSLDYFVSHNSDLRRSIILKIFCAKCNNSDKYNFTYLHDIQVWIAITSWPP